MIVSNAGIEATAEELGTLRITDGRDSDAFYFFIKRAFWPSPFTLKKLEDVRQSNTEVVFVDHIATTLTETGLEIHIAYTDGSDIPDGVEYARDILEYLLEIVSILTDPRHP